MKKKIIVLLIMLVITLTFLAGCKPELKPEPVSDSEMLSRTAPAPTSDETSAKDVATKEETAPKTESPATPTEETAPQPEKAREGAASESPQNESSGERVESAEMKESVPQPIELGIIIKDLQFTPSELKVKKNTKVTWVNLDEASHTVTGAVFDSGTLSNGKSYSFVFTEPGEYKYVCNIHPNMNGKIIVE